MTDAFSKYVVLRVIPNKSAEEVAKAFMEGWTVPFGVPVTLVSDNGKEFCNHVLDNLAKLLNVRRVTTAPYHPQSNAQVEVFNKTMNGYLAKMLVQAQLSDLDWELYILPLMVSHNTAVHKATKLSPFATLLGYDPRMPLWAEGHVWQEEESAGTAGKQENFVQRHLQTQQMLREEARDNNIRYRDQYLKEHARAKDTHAMDFQPGDLVWYTWPQTNFANRKFAPKKERAKILDTNCPGNFLIKFVDRTRRTTKNTNVSFLTPRLEEEPTVSHKEAGPGWRTRRYAEQHARAEQRRHRQELNLRPQAGRGWVPQEEAPPRELPRQEQAPRAQREKNWRARHYEDLRKKKMNLDPCSLTDELAGIRLSEDDFACAMEAAEAGDLPLDCAIYPARRALLFKDEDYARLLRFLERSHNTGEMFWIFGPWGTAAQPAPPQPLLPPPSPPPLQVPAPQPVPGPSNARMTREHNRLRSTINPNPLATAMRDFNVRRTRSRSRDEERAISLPPPPVPQEPVQEEEDASDGSFGDLSFHSMPRTPSPPATRKEVPPPPLPPRTAAPQRPTRPPTVRPSLTSSSSWTSSPSPTGSSPDPYSSSQETAGPSGHPPGWPTGRPATTATTGTRTTGRPATTTTGSRTTQTTSGSSSSFSRANKNIDTSKRSKR
jgi:hypothetical protein